VAIRNLSVVIVTFRRVSLTPGSPVPGESVSSPVSSDVDEALSLAGRLADSGLRPGDGRTQELFETLATLGAEDVGVARVVEPHLDAIAILGQAGQSELAPDGSTWGVFAAEGGEPLCAEYTEDGWTLNGRKPWCSLAGRLTHALVTATVSDGRRQLFVVELGHSRVTVVPDAWHARGFTEIPSGPVIFDRVPALPVGEANWYLVRPGFAWGGIAVAACWYGGAVGIARAVYEAVMARPDPGDILLMHLGSIDSALGSARRALAEAAAQIDEGTATGRLGALLAKRVRSTVARATELTIHTAGHALGPAPLAQDADYAKRIADLQLYIRQHHAEKDDASLGRELAGTGELPW
jgi:hypothetical protein